MNEWIRSQQITYKLIWLWNSFRNISSRGHNLYSAHFYKLFVKFWQDLVVSELRRIALVRWFQPCLEPFQRVHTHKLRSSIPPRSLASRSSSPGEGMVLTRWMFFDQHDSNHTSKSSSTRQWGSDEELTMKQWNNGNQSADGLWWRGSKSQKMTFL